ncbi:hypothetical protein AK812_SmicGene5008 [Symbiodinium microadriaticum]|uniref:Uncharacterized protein n=1 Tax=Symbiodinium microadriaticum TaxID=2951 RepID=A0A1Q9EUX5_SYMMI|nr:hypothetical protein AK812_SmicGene5008 [Symbiodinium microadriaticum]
MSSRITRAPDLVNQIGDGLLNYLAETQHYRLSFVQAEESEKKLDVFTDSSFATSSGRSHGCAAVFWGSSPISWRPARQQLVTLSTAESELLEAVEGAILGLSTQGLWEGFKFCLKKKEAELKELQRYYASQYFASAYRAVRGRNKQPCAKDLSIKYLDGKRSICSPIAGA